MSSNSSDSPQPQSLFVSEKGEPLSFYLRPGPMKQQLQPLITAGGGLLSNIQKPGTVLLCDPEEKAAEGENRFVSTQYIQDCTEKNQKLNIEDYRLNIGATNSAGAQNSARTKSTGRTGPATASGRSAYTPEQDDAILRYVSKRVTEIGGNRLWQIMAQKQVTGHSWQSMKYRFRVRLAHRLQEYKHTHMQENKMHSTGQTEAENGHEADTSPGSTFQVQDPMPQDLDPTPPCADSSPQRPEDLSVEMDITQVSQSSEELADVEPAQESEASNLMELCHSPQSHPEPTAGERQTTARTSYDLSPNSVNRPLTRRQVKLGAVPNVRKLRSGTSIAALKWSPGLLKYKPVASPRSHQKGEPSPPKKVQKRESREAEQMQVESQCDPSAIMQTDQGNHPAPQPPKERAEKRKLGILEMATKEFEDDSESDCDQFETPRSTSTEAVVGSSIDADLSASANHMKESSSTQPEHNPQSDTALSSTATLATITTATTTVSPDEASTSDPVVPEMTTKDILPPTEQATHKPHLFIFESESQQEELQSLISPCALEEEAEIAPSLTQDQLDEDVQLLRNIMEQSHQDIVSVTKSLLKASGDVALAFEILRNQSSFSGPVWTQVDDQRLRSMDQEARRDLLTKYGEEGVAKRMLFLE